MTPINTSHLKRLPLNNAHEARRLVRCLHQRLDEIRQSAESLRADLIRKEIGG